MAKKHNIEIKCPSCINYDAKERRCKIRPLLQGKCRLYFERQRVQ